MKFSRLAIPEIVYIQPAIHRDDRGYFTETFRQDQLDTFLGAPLHFVQDNESESTQGVFRGLHYQLPPYPQAKLIRVVQGRILDIALDIRKNSPTFGQHIQVELSAEQQNQLWVPHGFAHGFWVLSKTAKICYKVDNYYDRASERAINVNDPDLKIDLDLSQMIRSEKDLQAPYLNQAETF